MERVHSYNPGARTGLFNCNRHVIFLYDDDDDEFLFTYVVDGVYICLGDDQFLQCSTVSVPRGLVYRRVTMLYTSHKLTSKQTHAQYFMAIFSQSV